MFDNLISKSALKSPWLFHINAGSCNGCDIEVVAVITTLYDAERFGFKIVGSPRHADIVIVSGPVTMQSRDRLIRTLAQVPEPKCVVSVGSCPQSGNVFKGSYAIDGPLEKYVHVDVAVAGCSPKPEAIMEGLYKAAQILEEKRAMIRKAGKGGKSGKNAAALERGSASTAEDVTAESIPDKKAPEIAASAGKELSNAEAAAKELDLLNNAPKDGAAGVGTGSTLEGVSGSAANEAEVTEIPAELPSVAGSEEVAAS